jgi:hypothetical protein
MNDASISEPGGPDGLPSGGGTTTLDRELEELLQNQEPGDHERFSHYVKKEQILESAITGKPVKALCGKMWTPNRDPEKFPVCPTCREIYEKLKDE